MSTEHSDIVSSANLTPFQLQYLTALRDKSGRWKQCTNALKLSTVENGVTNTRYCIAGVGYELLNNSDRVGTGCWSYPEEAPPHHLHSTKYKWIKDGMVFNAINAHLAGQLELNQETASIVVMLNDNHRVSFSAFAKLFERYWSGERDVFRRLLLTKESDARIKKLTATIDKVQKKQGKKVAKRSKSTKSTTTARSKAK